MARRRSKGVTVWAWSFILTSVLGILWNATAYRHEIQFLGVGFFTVTALSTVAYLICGILLLKLNESARRAVIYLGLFSILCLPFGLARAAKSFALLGDLYAPQESAPIVLGVIGALGLVFQLIPIYFFTRPTVKAQFEPHAAG